MEGLAPDGSIALRTESWSEASSSTAISSSLVIISIMQQALLVCSYLSTGVRTSFLGEVKDMITLQPVLFARCLDNGNVILINLTPSGLGSDDSSNDE